jgi:hypothetical protein
LWVLSQNPFVKREFATHKEKNAEKKRIDNGFTYLGRSCLGGGRVHLFSGDGFM